MVPRSSSGQHDQLILGHLWIARHAARKYRGVIDQEDAESIVALELVRIAPKYDPSLGFKFSTFAWPYVIGRLKDENRKLRGRHVAKPLVLSLSAPMGEDEEEFDFQVPASDPEVELDSCAQQAFAFLNQRQQEIVYLHVVAGMTMKAIGELLHVSESRVCQLYKHSMGELQRRLTAQGCA